VHHFRPKFSFKSQWRPKYPASSSCGCLALGASSGALSGAGSFNFFRAYLKRLERQLENRTNHTISNQKVVILTNDKQFNSDKRGAKFTGKACLVPRSDEFECQGQRSRSPGTKNRHFSAISAACVQFMFGKTSLASSLIFFCFWFSDVD